jgi:hypothetical protein
MSIEEMKRDLAEAEKREVEARHTIHELAQAIADATCPLKVGQVVPVCGYSHHGKQMRITRIGYTRSRFDGDWNAHGTVLKADGTEGKQTADFGQRQWDVHEKKVAEQAAEGQG